MLIDDFDLLLLDDESFQSQVESKTISMQQYKYFMQLEPQVEKMKNSIRRMECVIKSKDSQIEELRRSLKNETGMYINASNLSIVSTL